LDNINEYKINKMERLKIKLLELLLKNIFKYNKTECREKWLETTLDDITYLLNN
jgi:hypothetical protein